MNVRKINPSAGDAAPIVFARLSKEQHCAFQPDGEITHLGGGWAESLATTDSLLFSRCLFDWVHPTDREMFMRTVQSLAVHGGDSPVVQELRLRTELGKFRWFESRMLREADGSTVYATFRDITEDRDVRIALREAEAGYHSLVESLPLQVFRKDRVGRFTFANKRFCDALQRDVEDVLGKNDYDFFPDNLAGKYADDDKRVVEQGIIFEDVEEYLTPSGEKRFVHVLKAPVRDRSQQIIGLQGVFWDVTERKITEEQLKQTAEALRRSNGELEQYAYVASHDLQEPLRTIVSFCELAERHCSERMDERGKDYLKFISHGAKQLQGMIRDLLEYARIGRNRLLRSQPSSEIVEGAVDQLREAIRESGARVQYGELPEISGDKSELIRLFQNIFANAIKFRGSEPPVITVEAQPLSGGALFAVKDNGVGIESELQPRIFNIFHRGKRTDLPGVGIGLATCRKIVESHGGRIWFESEEGKGTTFLFTLPVIVPEADHAS